jgi:hypothetical protein
VRTYKHSTKSKGNPRIVTPNTYLVAIFLLSRMSGSLASLAILGFEFVGRELLVAFPFQLGPSRISALGVLRSKGVVAGAFAFPTLLARNLRLPMVLIPTLGVVLLTLVARHVGVAHAVLGAAGRQGLLVRMRVIQSLGLLARHFAFVLFDNLFAVALATLLILLGVRRGNGSRRFLRRRNSRNGILLVMIVLFGCRVLRRQRRGGNVHVCHGGFHGGRRRLGNQDRRRRIRILVIA